MQIQNYINLTEAVLDKPIYRIMPIHRLLQTLDSQNLVLSKPKLWDDPFENALLSAAFLAPDGSKKYFAAKDTVYGQCWTVHRETDAMWRIYSAQKDGIRVASTPRKLYQSLIAVDKTFWQVRCFIGRVTYQTQKNLIKSLRGIKIMRQDDSGIAESLLYKRQEFRHEREVRLIYCADQQKAAPDLFSFHVAPDQIFDELTFDPRMDQSLVKAYELAIAEKKLKNVRVSQSVLYRAPKGLTFKL